MHAARTLIICIFLFATSTQAQTLTKHGDLYEYTFTSDNPETTHRSANVFTREIGNILKSEFPSKVLDPNVSLRVFSKDGKTLYRLTWNCRIVPASRDSAHYSFDRRGTLFSGKTLHLAKQSAEAEIVKSKKLQLFRSNVALTIPPHFVRESFSGSRTEGYWYIKEFFGVTPK